MASTTYPAGDAWRPLALGRSIRDGARRLAELAATPLVPADYLDVFNPLRRGADLRGRVVSVTPETEDAATLVIKPGADWAGHVPGQYVRVGIDVDGVRLWRAYSLTHGPRDDGYISITVKAVPDGKVSNHIVRDCHPGTLVHLEQAAGEFVLPPDGGKFLFVTAGSGITPVIGMLRNLFPVADSGAVRLQRSANFDITVVHVAPERAALDLHRQPAFARRGRDDPPRRAVRRRARRPRRRRPRRRSCPTCRSAPPSRAVRPVCSTPSRRHHAERGLKLLTEQFRVTPLVVGEGGTVSFLKNGTTLEATGDRPILEQAEEAGVLMPSGCRMGICYGCVLPMREGTVRDLRTGEITTAVEGDGVRIQTCINAAAGSCQIDH